MGELPEPTFADVLDAARQIRPYLSPTPLRRYPALDRLTGADVHVKHENHNPTGAFKVRGGVNLVSRLSEDERTALQRYVECHERADPDALAALLREDARMMMPPIKGWYQGRAAIVTLMSHSFDPDFGHLQCAATRANRQPAVAWYLQRPGESEHRAGDSGKDSYHPGDDQLPANVRVEHLSDAAPDLIEVGAVILWNKATKHSLERGRVDSRAHGGHPPGSPGAAARDPGPTGARSPALAWG